MPVLKFSYFGHEIVMNQDPVSGVETGWRIWNAAYVVLRYLEKTHTKEWFKGKKIIDLSCGTGIVGLCLSILGATVVLTEIPGRQLELIRENVKLNKDLIEKGRGGIEILELLWGTEDSEKIFDAYTSYIDLVVASDLLYIAIRDNLQNKLIHALLHSIPKKPTSCLLLIYQERRAELESEMIEILKEKCTLKLLAVESECYKDVIDDRGGDVNQMGLISLFGGVDDDANIILCSLSIKT